MIRYALKCAQGHAFDSWFASAEAYDRLRGAGHVACAVCGDATIEKALMAPSVGSVGAPEAAADPTQERGDNEDLADRLAALRRHVEQNADYVGTGFAAEARAIHDGDAPDRPIWGEARLEEAKALVDDGVPVAPLPFGRKSQGH